MNNSTPILTIVIPCFNNMDLTSFMLDSIIANTFQHWELLAVDDGSTEVNFARLKEYESIDSRIRVIKRTCNDKGAPVCRNIGFSLAKGKYIIFFDSDDYITPTCLETRIQEMEAHKELDFMVFPSGIFVENGFKAEALDDIYGYDVHKDDLESFARRELPFIVWSNIYRTESLRRYGIEWDTNLLSLQDADFNMLSLLAGMKYSYAKEKPDYGYRISYSSETISKKIWSEEHLKSHVYATDKFFRLLQNAYGHKYDKAVVQGTYCIYNRVFTDGINHSAALDFVNCVSKYNKWLGAIFKIQFYMTCVLEIFLPAKRARQIPMTLYLVSHYWRGKQLNKKKILQQKEMINL